MNKNWLCRVGIHHWKPVQRYSKDGVVVTMMGLPSRIHHVATGVEKCARCKKEVKGRCDWLEWSMGLACASLAVLAGVLLVTTLVAAVRMASPSLAEVFRAAYG